MTAARESGGGDGLVREAHVAADGLLRPRPALYAADLLLSAAAGWGALAAGAALVPRPAAIPCLVLAVVALFRAASFIHELTHLRPGALSGFTVAWNLLVGVPLLLPSLLYVGGVHAVHHARPHYGTPGDPEYLPLARWPPWRLAASVLFAAAVPLALALRFLVLAPASALHPAVRRRVWAHASSLAVNPDFVRAPPPPGLRRRFLLEEAATAAWAWLAVALAATGAVPARFPAAVLGASATVAGLNQLRTLVAHRWRSAGAPLSLEEQFLDSVNVAGPLAALWAPVGLRFHALHHLLPGVPYHALGEVRRRLLARAPSDARLRRVEERGLVSALRALTS